MHAAHNLVVGRQAERKWLWLGEQFKCQPDSWEKAFNPNEAGLWNCGISGGRRGCNPSERLTGKKSGHNEGCENESHLSSSGFWMNVLKNKQLHFMICYHQTALDLELELKLSSWICQTHIITLKSASG